MTLSGADRTVTVSASTLTVGSAFGLAKSGAGALVLTNAASTFTGQVTLRGGVTSVSKLAISGSNSSLGTGSVASSLIIDAGTLTYTGSGDTTNRAIDMRAGATINNDGTGALTFSAADVTQGGTASARTLTLGGTNTAANTFASALGDSGTAANITSLTKSGSGTWLLSGANTYTGVTSILGGTLSVASLNKVTGGVASSSLGAPVTGANGTIAIGSTTTGGTLLYTGLGEDTDRVVNLAGTTGGATIDLTGSTGLLRFTSAFTATGAGAKTLTLTGGAGTLGELGGAVVNSASATSLTKTGAGTWTLSGANTYTGLTTLTAGTIAVGNAGALGAAGATLALNGGTITSSSSTGYTLTAAGASTIGGNVTFGNGTNTGSLTLTNAFGLGSAVRNLTVATGTTATLSGVISNTSGGLTKSGAGTLVLSGASANTFTGVFTLSEGTVAVGKASALGAAGATLALNGGTITSSSSSGYALTAAGASSIGGNVTFGDGTNTGALTFANNFGLGSATRTLTVAAATSATLSGVVSNGGLTKTGNGTLTLSGANSYAGATTLSSGTLLLGHASALGSTSGLTLNGGTLASSSAAARTVSQAVSVGGDITLGQVSGGTGQLGFTGPMDLGGGSRTLTTNTDVALRGAVSNGALVKAGPGTLVLAQTPSITALTITAGKTMVLSSSGLGAASVTLAGGELQLTQVSGDLTGNLVLSGPAASNAISHGLAIDYLVVGGGGGGAARDSGGGGGGGGVLSNLTNGTAPLLLTSGTTSVTVGGGGAGAAIVPPGDGATAVGSTGGSSALGSITVLGGGGGGGYGSAGSSGATGGGSGRNSASTAGTPGQGFAGGAGSLGTTNSHAGGGGGGAGGAGQAGVVSSKGGNGGAGLVVDITGSSVFYGGGGGGTPHRASNPTSMTSGSGGSGGGGAGAANANSNPTAGTANTGGGGGAARNDGTTGTGSSSGASGGSGIVIVRYLGDAVATGGTITAGTGSSAGFTLHTFTTAGQAQLVFATDRRVTGVISGSGGFTYATAGSRLFLDSTNTYEGGTLVNAGTLVANAAGALGSGSVTVNSGGILQSAVSGALGSVPVTLGSGGRLNVTAVGGIGSSSFTAGSGSLVAFRTDAFSLAQIATETAGVTWQAGSALALDTTGGDFTISQELQPSAGIAKLGTNNLTFSFADSTRSGNVSVLAGGVRLGAPNALGSGILALSSGTSLSSDGSTPHSAANDLTIQGNIALGSATATGALTLSGTVDLGGATRILTVDSATSLAGVVSNGGLAKAGSGALTLTGVNTYTGLTTLSAGTLALSSANALGAAAATLALNGGTVTSSSSTGYTLTAAGASTIGGDVTFGDGTNTGSLTFTNNFGFGSAARTLSVATGTTTTLSGVLSNTSGGLTKAGAGTLVLSGATTFTGNLTVSAGTLRITGSNSAAPGTVAVNSGGTLDLTGGQGIFRTLAFSGSTTHVNIAGGTVVVDKFEYGDNNDFNQLRNNYYSIALTSGGRIRHTANESFLRAVTVDVGGAVFETAAGVTVTKLAGSTASQNLTRFSANSSLTFAGAGTYIMQDSLAPASWGNTGFSIAKQDSGTLRLTGTNLYTGGTSVTGGTLEFASGALSATGAITVNGGTLRWLSGNTQDISSRLTLVPSGSAALDTNGNNVTLGTGIGGSTSSSLTKSGAGILALGAANSFAGGLAVNGGRVDVSALGSLGSGPVSIGSAGALRLSLTLPGASSLSTLFSHGLSGTGILDLNLSGENPLALGGYANFGGSVRVTSGVFDNSGFAGGIIFAGGRLLDPSSFTGTTTVSGPITDVSQLPTGGTLVLDAGGSIDFGQTPYTGTILYRGGAVSGSGFQGVLDVDAPSVAVSGSFGQGSLRVGAGRGVDLTGPTTGTILFDGGSITGGGNLTGRLQLGAGRSLVLGAGLDVLPNTVTLGVAAGTSVDLAWSATAATIDFTGGSIANAANFAGTIAVSQNAIFSTNGTVGGTVNLGSGTTLSGNGIFTGTVTAAAGATLSPGASPGLTSYQTLNLNGGSAVNLEFFSAFETVTIDGQSRRGYDSLLAETLNFGTAGEVGGGSILLRLATLTNWNDMVPDWNGTSGFLPAEGSSLIHGPLDGPKEFVIARFNTSDRLGMLTNGLNVTPWFTFDADLYRGTGASGFQVIANTGDTSAWELNMIAVPEPSACGLILGGVVVAAGLWRRRRATIR